MQLYYEFLQKFSQLPRCSAVIVAGNHDSPAHLDAPRGLLKHFNIHVVGSPSQERREDLIHLERRDETSDTVVVCAIPYLRDRDVLRVVSGEAYTERQERLREGIYQYYRETFRLAAPLREQGIPLIATGHLTLQATASTQPSDHEIGTLSSLEASRFPQEADYVSLGHLHAPHAVGTHPEIRYAGSPFPMSFAEASQEKSVVITEFKEGRLDRCHTHPIPTFRILYRYSGTLADLPSWMEAHRPATDSALTPWLELHLSDRATSSLSDQVMQVVHDEPFEVLKILSQAEPETPGSWKTSDTSLQELTPSDVFAERLRAADLDPLQDETLTVFAELLALHETRRLELDDPVS